MIRFGKLTLSAVWIAGGDIRRRGDIWRLAQDSRPGNTRAWREEVEGHSEVPSVATKLVIEREERREGKDKVSPLDGDLVR